MLSRISRSSFIAVTSLVAFTGVTKAATSLCATPEQATEIREAYIRQPGAPPFVIGKMLGVPEETVITGLPPSQSVGTSNGQAFAKVWESLAGWDRPIVAIPLPNDNIVEFSGPIGTKVTSSNGEVQIETERSGLRGHFHPSSIAAIHAITLARDDGKMLHGVVFLGADGKSIISVYSLIGKKSEYVRLLSTDAYQRTRDLIASMPSDCPQADPRKK